MKKTLLILFIITSFNTKAQRVSPFQSGSYYPSILSLRDYAAPPPGLIFADYNLWFNSGSIYDKDGNKVELGNSFENSPLDEISVDPNISSYTNMFLIYYVSRFKIFGARYMASVSPMYLSMKYDVKVEYNGNTQTESNKISGLGDLALMPVGLSWASQKMDYSFLYTMYIPTGRYTTGADDNLGTGYWTHQLQTPVYFYAMQQATALAVIPTIEFSGQIKDADVNPGNRFSLEYGISQYLSDQLEVELMNGHNWQITDDKGSDECWANNYDSKNTFSTGINYWIIDKLQLRGKFLQDYGVKQRFKNQIWHFSLLYVPGLLSEKEKN